MVILEGIRVEVNVSSILQISYNSANKANKVGVMCISNATKVNSLKNKI